MSENLFEEFIAGRNLKPSSKTIYKSILKQYCQFNNMTLEQLIIEAENEENIPWKKRKLRQRLIAYRSYLYKNYLENTAKGNLTKVITFYKYFEIDIHYLPTISNITANKSKPLTYDDMLTKEILHDAVEISNDFFKAYILFACSSGCARREMISITVDDYLKATSDYHNSNNLADAICEMEGRDIIATFKLKRYKTNKFYTTFTTPEAIKACNVMLMDEYENKTPETPIFDRCTKTISKTFNRLNDQLGLGKAGTYRRLRTHMFRKYHASALYNDGLSISEINALQGRAKDKTHEAYFYENPEKLKRNYIEHIDAVTITRI